MNALVYVEFSMTNSKIFDEVGCPDELKRAKKFIKKQADIILALEKEIEQKDNEILLIKERKKNETKTT